MTIVLDESVSHGLCDILRRMGHDVVSIAEGATAGNGDEEVYKLACTRNALLITRDYHFTNPLRYPPDKTAGIIYIRHGNLTSDEEIQLVGNFLEKYPFTEYQGRLITLYKNSVKFR
jgi:predicted nuclease of predicted toxin-antitoxin system